MEQKKSNNKIPKKPKWFQVRAKREFKKHLIDNILNDYKKPIIIDKKKFTPTDEEIKQYYEDLNKLGLKDLLTASKTDFSKEGMKSLGDKLRRQDKKNAILIRIVQKNNTISTFITNKHSRFVEVQGNKYLCPPNAGLNDNNYNMVVYTYFYGNPFPIEFLDDRAITTPDGEFLSKTTHFEFAQKMAEVTDMKRKADLTMVASIMSALLSAGAFIVCLKGFGMI